MGGPDDGGDLSSHAHLAAGVAVNPRCRWDGCHTFLSGLFIELKRPGPYPGGVVHMSLPRGWSRLWNWKSALLSSLFRALIFFFANWKAGSRAAIAAMLAELLYRALTAGFYGSITQRLRRLEPPWRGALAASVLLPTIGHSLEWGVHTLRGTPNLRTSITASIAFTLVSSLFHLFAMRRGHFIVGAGSRPLLDDLRHVPVLMRDFMLAGPRLLQARDRAA